jgi:hypothetical protein
MPELILPGVYIETRAEALIVPGRVTVGNVGVVGTANKGEIGEPTLLSSFADAQQQFGAYDSFIDPATGKRRIDATGKPNELTLVRALEQVFANGATTVFAVRIAGTGANAAKKASHTLMKGPDKCVTLAAKTAGTWGNDLQVNVAAAEENGFVEKEDVDPAAPTLKHKPVFQSQRNRVTHTSAVTGITRIFSGVNIVYTGAPTADQVKIDPATGDLTFHASLGLAAGDKVTASYAVDKASAVKVTLRLGNVEEVYTVVSGNDLAADIKEQSALVDTTPEAKAGDLPDKSSPADAFAAFKDGTNGEAGANYKDGLETLLNEDVQIIVAAGQDDDFGGEMHKHCQKAASDLIKRDRIGLVGSDLKGADTTDTFLDKLRGHSVASDRVIFVAPGIKVFDAAASEDVILPGSYAAAAVAGLLASFSAHVSLTNKVLGVNGLEERFTSAQLQQLVQNRVLALEERKGFRIVKGITTDEGAFTQITTRRIVDFAKFGVRSAAGPYIGLLNNERVRGALRATINSFLTEMVEDEMLVSYELSVTATRDEERKGIAKVTIVLRPTFSIDFIKVTMILE